MSKSSKKVKVNSVSQGKLPAAENIKAGRPSAPQQATAPSHPTIGAVDPASKSAAGQSVSKPSSAIGATTGQPQTSNQNKAQGSVSLPKSASSSNPAGAFPDKSSVQQTAKGAQGNKGGAQSSQPQTGSTSPASKGQPAPQQPQVAAMAAQKSAGQIQAQQQQSSNASATQRSQQQQGRKVQIQFFCPTAQSVMVAGTFNEWKPDATPLVKAGGGRWATSLDVGPGRYEYLFIVDGQWQPDPSASETVGNPYGGSNCVLVVE